MDQTASRPPAHRRLAALVGSTALIAGAAALLAPPAHAAPEDPTGLAEPVVSATLVGEQPDLPATVAVETEDGSVRDAAVTWSTEDLQFDQHYRTYAVPGVVEDDLAVTAWVETIPADLRYYIDAGTTTSTAYDAASTGAALLNEAPDRAASDDGWGYLDAGIDGTRTVTATTDKYANGHYGYNSSTLPLAYRLTGLSAGTYTVTVGVQEWWSGPRTIAASVSGGGLDAEPLGAEVTVSSSARTAVISGSVTLTEDGDIAVDLQRTAGTEAPVIAWLAVAAGEIDVDTSVRTVATPTADVPGGTYGRAQTISLTSETDGAAVYYTTDGTAPTAATGTRYTDPVQVAETTRLRAVAVRDGIISSELDQRYVIEPAPEGGYTSVPVGQTWYDTDGVPIQAHGGGFLQHDGWYYWVGENKSHNGANLLAVSLYRSQDLMNWEHAGDIVTIDTEGVCETGSYTGPDCKIERPKLLYNEATDTFVMWGHWETDDSYAASHLIVATSPTIDGDYEIVRNFRPGVGEVTTEHEDPTYDGGDDLWGYGSRDFTVFTDPDTGAGYLLGSEDHLSMRLYPLTEDFTDVDWEASYPVFEDQSREAPAVVKIDGRWYAFTSGQSGWYPNQTRFAFTDDITDPQGWSELQTVGNNTSYYSQPTNIMTIQGAGGERSYIYMGDRWNSKQLGSSTYVWLPLSIDDGGAVLDYQPSWEFDPATAQITTPAVELVSQGQPATATSEAEGRPAGQAVDGVVTNLNRSGDSTNYFQPTAIPASWQVDLGEVVDLSRVDLSWRSWNGSETRSTYQVWASVDGTEWSLVADRSDNTTVGFTSDPLSALARYVRVDITSVINDHNGNAAVWAAGLVEVQVYAVTDIADTTAPDVRIEAGEPSPSGWHLTRPLVEVTATDDGGVALVETSADGETWTAYDEAFWAAEGSTTVWARATDTAGNVSDPVRLELKVDSVAPVVHSRLDEATSTLRLAASDASSGVASVQYRIGSGGWQTYTAPFGVPAGGNVHYRATDVAGHTSGQYSRTIPSVSSGGAVELTPSVAARCQDGQAVVAVHVRNAEPVAADVRITSVWGSVKTRFAGGAATYQAFESGTGSVSEGTVTVAGYTWVDGVASYTAFTVPYPALSCTR